MVYCYGDFYDIAISSLSKSIELQEPLGRPRLLSVYKNALAYAILMNQGSSSGSNSGLPKHYHLHERDIRKSFQYFEEALEENSQNKAALKNYLSLCEVLEKPARADFEDRAAKLFRFDHDVSYSKLPYNALESASFIEFDEVVFLLDISGSMVMEQVLCMSSTRFQVMKETLLYLLEHAPPDKSYGIGTIGGDCDTEPKLWHPAGHLSMEDLRWYVETVAPHGTTPLLGRLKSSIELFSDDESSKKSIFLISDGANVCREGSLDICHWASQAAKKNVTINILTFLDAKLNNANAFAEYGCLAHNTKGRILYMDNNRCRLQYLSFKVVEESLLYLPELEKTECFDESHGNNWAIFPGGKKKGKNSKRD